MKKFVLLLLLLFKITSYAQEELILVQKNGSISSFSFANKPVVSYTESKLVLSTDNEEIIFPIDSLVNIFFSTEKINRILDVRSIAKITISDYSISISNEEVNSIVLIMGIDGKNVKSFSIDNKGEAEFSLEDLKKGIYIVKTKSVTCKLLIK